MAVLEARGIVEPARLNVLVPTDTVPHCDEQWPLRLIIENPGAVAVEDLYIHVSVSNGIDLEKQVRSRGRVGIDDISSLVRVPRREDERVDEESRVMDLLRPGQRRVWGAGYFSFRAPGEYPVRVTIKAKNLAKPFDESLKLNVTA